MTIPRAPITIGITVTFKFHSFFSIPYQGPITYLSFRFLSISLCGQLAQQCQQFVKFFCCCWWLLGLVVLLRLGDLFVSQNPWGVSAFNSPGRILWLYIYYLFVWSNFNFLHSSQWITLPTQVSQVLYYFIIMILPLRVFHSSSDCCFFFSLVLWMVSILPLIYFSLIL